MKSTAFGWFRKASQAPKAAGETSPTRGELWRENIESLIWAVALALIIRTFIMAPFKIPSGSMRPTLIEGDRILVNKYTYRFNEPERGDIVVFKYPVDGKRPFIKRLIAKGGERVEIRDGHIRINEAEVTEPEILRQITYYNQGEHGKQQQVVEVPEGQYFVLGDNSASSHDSRFWGFVPRKNVIGKAMCIFWPPTRIRGLR